MEKSYNIVAAELLDLIKQGYGITQAMRKIEITNAELVICLNKNTELARFCKDRFNIEADGLAVKTEQGEDEKAQLRARCEQLGLKPHTQAGVAKLKKMIEEKEAELAAAANAQPAEPVVPSNPAADADQTQTNKTDDEKAQNADNSENANSQEPSVEPATTGDK